MWLDIISGVELALKQSTRLHILHSFCNELWGIKLVKCAESHFRSHVDLNEWWVWTALSTGGLPRNASINVFESANAMKSGPLRSEASYYIT